jgi:hypothetical protein
MKKGSNYKSVWDITSQSEKERIFSMFLKEYGEHYTPDDFVKFLKKRYKVPYHTPQFNNRQQRF